MTDLARLYQFRFDEADRARKMAIWKVLCGKFFQKLVGENKVVLDMASGYGEFSSNIRARHKIAADINPDARRFLPEGVEFHSESATDLGGMGQIRSTSCSLPTSWSICVTRRNWTGCSRRSSGFSSRAGSLL